MAAADSGDWDKTQALIKHRDQELSALPADFSDYSQQQQLELRRAIESLDGLNAEFILFTNSKRGELLKAQQDLTKNKTAINSYLDNS